MKRIGLLILVSSLLGIVGVAHADDVGVGQITEPAWERSGFQNQRIRNRQILNGRRASCKHVCGSGC